MLVKILTRIEFALFLIVLSSLFSGSSLVVNDHTDQIRKFSRVYEFDYFDWTINSIAVKILQSSIDSPFYFNKADQQKIVLDYIKITEQIIIKESQLDLIYMDPSIHDPDAYSNDLRLEIVSLKGAQSKIAPIAESILEKQVTEVLQEVGLTLGGQPTPPVSFHITPLPYNLIISPRYMIEQQDSISLISNLPIDKQSLMEAQIENELNVSALVVPVGGIGSYPTMVERSTSLQWLSSTITHEWIHNWLSFQPLGQRYETSNDLRTMNETVASIAGDEIGNMVIERFYPEIATNLNSKILAKFPFSHPDPDDIPVIKFDFRAEMHKTRIVVDQLLLGGKIVEAENYMEGRRKIFWNNGYPIRKLNQAYFAFYGAYADIPGGAAGEDPVGPAVRALRAKSPDLASFLKNISKMVSFESLKAAISY